MSQNRIYLFLCDTIMNNIFEKPDTKEQWNLKIKTHYYRQAKKVR